MPKTAPYGTWSSPITAEALTKSSISIGDVLIDPVTSTVYHVENRPTEGGRSVVVNTKSKKDVFGSEWNARTGVQEYGGAAAIVHGGVVYLSHFADNRLYAVKEGAQPEAVTPDNKNHRFADFTVHPKHTHLLVAILEDHTHPLPADVVTSLAVINTHSKTVSIIISGADFYNSPRFSPDGKHLAWQQWFHPDMPWEGSEIHVGDVVVSAKGELSIAAPAYIAGRRGDISAAYPFWTADDILVFSSDVSGYYNPWKYSCADKQTVPIFPSPVVEDFNGPSWLMGWSHGAPLESGKIFFTAYRDGRNVFYLVGLQSGSLEEVKCPYATVEYIRRLSRDQVVFMGRKDTEPAAVVLCTISKTSPTFTVLKSTAGESDSAFPPSIISVPEPFSLKVPPHGEPLYVVFYPPRNPEYSGTSIDGEKPPCVVHIHGGPTSAEPQGLDWKKQYFTSRGFAWLDVNYGGSSWYGRRYTDRLVGKWGIVDVQDTVAAVETLSGPSHSLIDPKRLAIRGGSAGGFTTLAALCFSPATFAAGTSSYGVSDLRKLAEDTHKFESRYLEKLVGGTPELVPEIYKERSPVFHADKIMSPLLILQGSIDAVVPPEQAEAIVKDIEARGGKVEYILFEGEGHGWRKAENIKIAMEKEIQFYEEVFGLKK
ncbi:hypothetical protein JAAARDRAFT_129506 [Jaapia argillacea MUCL 33604]|uniref:Peptidase S9 prolyl oligopeptidase catalytic domain-containing protein n=1 Tax=Jaapia argillacea MUCL 33604 TaxID=933084 RepID=A0A067PSY1_9AGAM|nr:hypothetical protein JAAARDRAFT_129506 [Jaapia argillacea MUCL 33604]